MKNALVLAALLAIPALLFAGLSFEGVVWNWTTANNDAWWAFPAFMALSLVILVGFGSAVAAVCAWLKGELESKDPQHD